MSTVTAPVFTGAVILCQRADRSARSRQGTRYRLSAVLLFRGHGQRQGETLDNPACLRIRIVSG